MDTETTTTKPEHQKSITVHHSGGSDSVYGIGLIGAWIYFFRRATTKQERIQAFFKGFAWPAFLVLWLFEFLEKK